jgi:hypothetical protein
MAKEVSIQCYTITVGSGRLNVVKGLKRTNSIKLSVLEEVYNISLAYRQSQSGFIWLETIVTPNSQYHELHTFISLDFK